MIQGEEIKRYEEEKAQKAESIILEQYFVALSLCWLMLSTDKRTQRASIDGRHRLVIVKYDMHISNRALCILGL